MRTTKSKKASLRCGIREAKTHLSGLLKEVQAGREVVITDRGRPVGKLVPYTGAEITLDEWLLDLELRGWLDAGASEKRQGRIVPLPLSGVPDGLAQQILREDRDAS